MYQQDYVKTSQPIHPKWFHDRAQGLMCQNLYKPPLLVPIKHDGENGDNGPIVPDSLPLGPPMTSAAVPTFLIGRMSKKHRPLLCAQPSKLLAYFFCKLCKTMRSYIARCTTPQNIFTTSTGFPC